MGLLLFMRYNRDSIMLELSKNMLINSLSWELRLFNVKINNLIMIDGLLMSDCLNVYLLLF